MYHIFEQLLQKHEVSTYKVSKETGIAQSVFSAWKNGVSTPKSDKMQKIADYFKVPLDYLNGTNPQIKKAIDKYGFCWPPAIREDIKVDSRSTVYDESAPLETRVLAAENIFKSYFSRSLEANQYDLRHPDFPDFVAMLLSQSGWKERWGDDLYNALLEKYGIGPNLIVGTYFYCNALDNKKDDSAKKTILSDQYDPSVLTGIYFSLGAKAREKGLSKEQVKNIMNIIDSMTGDDDKK